MEGLQREVIDYLAHEEYDPTLANILLKGTVERVGALVSRVLGTFEFEVQPLREYFAARHLHKTAPYSPPGNAKKGTRPDRFSALASSFYWTNVTRFYCGFYDVGELPSLVDGLIAIGGESGYRLISQPRRLAMMLLGDYVFSQSPRSMRQLINFITREPDFQRLTGADTMQGQRGMRLPETAGGKMLFEVSAARLRKENDPSLCRALRQVMARNGDQITLKEFWWREYREGRIGEDPLTEARDLGLVEEFDAREIAKLTNGNIKSQLHWLSEANLHQDILDDKKLYEEACRLFFNLEIAFGYHRPFQIARGNPLPLVVLAELLYPHALSEYFTIPPEHRIELGRRDYFRQNFLQRIKKSDYEPEQHELLEFTQFVVELMELPADKWRSDLAPWEAVVDRGFVLAPRGRLFSMMAMIATAVSTRKQKPEDRDSTRSLNEFTADDTPLIIEQVEEWRDDGFDPSPGLVRRLYFARSQGGNCSWWKKQLWNSTGEARIILLCTMLCWSESSVLRFLEEHLSTALNELNEDECSWLWDLLSVGTSASRGQSIRVSDDLFRDDMFGRERLAIVLTRRLSEETDRRAVVRKCFYRYNGDDPRILQTAAEWELFSEPSDDIDWTFAQNLSSLARKNEIGFLFSHSHIRQQIDVPLEVAESVLEHCQLHNSQFVSLCERAFAANVAQGARKVSSVAEAEKWFSGDRDN